MPKRIPYFGLAAAMLLSLPTPSQAASSLPTPTGSSVEMTSNIPSSLAFSLDDLDEGGQFGNIVELSGLIKSPSTKFTLKFTQDGTYQEASIHGASDYARYIVYKGHQIILTTPPDGEIIKGEKHVWVQEVSKSNPTSKDCIIDALSDDLSDCKDISPFFSNNRAPIEFNHITDLIRQASEGIERKARPSLPSSRGSFYSTWDGNVSKLAYRN